MQLSVAVMVSVDKRELYELFLPGISTKTFRGVSLAELLDDVALHLMEVIPGQHASSMVKMQFCPHVELRRVKVSPEFPLEGTKKTVGWSGRVTVVVTRWPEDKFCVVHVPRLGLESFAVESTAYLEEGLTRFLQDWSKRNGGVTNFDAITSRSYEYLEILEVDTELPTILPSRPPKVRKKKKRAKKKASRKKNRDQSFMQRHKRRLVPPVTLREVGINLNHRATDGRLGRTFGREALVEQVSTQLERDGAAILLVGPAGVGKTAVLHEVVRRMAAQQRPIQERCDVWSVDGNRIIAGMSVVGAWEKRCEQMVAELSARLDILYVDDLPALVYTGRSAQSDTNVAEFLEPHLARGDLRIIGECTPERLEAVREEAPGFFARFHIIQVPELDERQTLMVLLGALRRYEAQESICIDPEVLEGILSLTRRFMARRCHPGKAVELLSQVVTDYRGVERDRFGRRQVDRKKLVEVFSQQTGLPRFVLWEQQSMRHRQILAHFERRIVAQQEASDAVSDVVTVLQQGLNDPHRPLSTMLFVGPTGVGKTETAKALAEFLFGNKDRLIRFDMSEFRDPISVTRLFGDRFNPEGELTRRVAQQPFSVVLFDEIEKAHPAVFDAFLQVLGEGRLTNAAGRMTDFCNTVIIMTSNLGVRESQRSVGFGDVSHASRDVHFRKAAEEFFRPEFFNRIDRIVAFRSLGRDAMRPLVARILQEILGRRGLRRSGVLVQVAPELVELLVDQGFEPRYGARSLKRALEQRLTTPLARHLVSQPVDKTTLIDLHRQGEEIGMELWALDDAQRAPWSDGGTRRTFHGLKDRYALIRQGLDALEDSALVGQMADARGQLIEQFNQEALDVPQWARLDSVSELLRSLKALREQADDFHDRFLLEYDVRDSAEVVEPSLLNNYGYKTNPLYMAPSVEVLALDRAKAVREAWGELDELEMGLVGVRYRADATRRSERVVLMRLLPATDDPAAFQWVQALAGLYRSCWSQWADVSLLAHVKDRGWKRWDEVSTERQEGIYGHFRPVVTAMALEVRGAGMLALIEQEVGYHLDTSHVGPDMMCNLVRVDEVGDGQTDALQRLEALDAQMQAWRRARLAGEDAPHPLGRLPVLRRFKAGVAVDVETGVTLDLSQGHNAELFSQSSADGLSRVVLRRLVLEMPVAVSKEAGAEAPLDG